MLPGVCPDILEGERGEGNKERERRERERDAEEKK